MKPTDKAITIIIPSTILSAISIMCAAALADNDKEYWMFILYGPVALIIYVCVCIYCCKTSEK